MNKFTFALLFCLGGCSFESKFKVEKKEEATTTDKSFVIRGPLFPKSLDVIVIDNCEYLYDYDGGNGGYVLCHKGNCNNPVHIYNK